MGGAGDATAASNQMAAHAAAAAAAQQQLTASSPTTTMLAAQQGDAAQAAATAALYQGRPIAAAAGPQTYGAPLTSPSPASMLGSPTADLAAATSAAAFYGMGGAGMMTPTGVPIVSTAARSQPQLGAQQSKDKRVLCLSLNSPQ